MYQHCQHISREFFQQHCEIERYKSIKCTLWISFLFWSSHRRNNWFCFLNLHSLPLNTHETIVWNVVKVVLSEAAWCCHHLLLTYWGFALYLIELMCRNLYQQLSKIDILLTIWARLTFDMRNIKYRFFFLYFLTWSNSIYCRYVVITRFYIIKTLRGYGAASWALADSFLNLKNVQYSLLYLINI